MRTLPPSGLPIELVPVLPQPQESQAQPQSRRHRQPCPPDSRQSQVQEFLDQQSLEPVSRKTYQSVLQGWLDWCALPWSEVTSERVQAYQQFLSQERHLAANSVNKAIAILKRFFAWYSSQYSALMPTNPAARVKLDRIELPPVADLSPQQMQQIWAVLQAGRFLSRDLALVQVLCHGLRAGEIVALDRSCFDGRVLHLATTQGDAARKVPLRPEAVAALQAYLGDRSATGEVLSPERPLFLSHTPRQAGQRLTYQGIYYLVKQLAKATGIATLHPHSFRHTYITTLLRAGVGLDHTRQLSGHKRQQTFQRYRPQVEPEAAIAAFYQAIGADPATGSFAQE